MEKSVYSLLFRALLRRKTRKSHCGLTCGAHQDLHSLNHTPRGGTGLSGVTPYACEHLTNFMSMKSNHYLHNKTCPSVSPTDGSQAGSCSHRSHPQEGTRSVHSLQSVHLEQGGSCCTGAPGSTAQRVWHL